MTLLLGSELCDGFILEEVTSSLGINARHVSMDTPLSEGEESTLLDVLENHNAEKTDAELAHHQSLKLEIERSLQTLTERQKEVVCYFFGLGVDHPLSLEDIGEKIQPYKRKSPSDQG